MPRILQRAPRHAPQPREPVLSDHPIAFSSMGADGQVHLETRIARNELGRLIEVSKCLEQHILPTIGLHGFTRLTATQARRLAKELRVLQERGESIAQSWLTVVDDVARRPSGTLLVAAGL